MFKRSIMSRTFNDTSVKLMRDSIRLCKYQQKMLKVQQHSGQQIFWKWE